MFVFDLYELEKFMDNLHYYPSFSIPSMLAMILFQESRLQSGSIEFISFNKQNFGFYLNWCWYCLLVAYVYTSYVFTLDIFCSMVVLNFLTYRAYTFVVQWRNICINGSWIQKEEGHGDSWSVSLTRTRSVSGAASCSSCVCENVAVG